MLFNEVLGVKESLLMVTCVRAKSQKFFPLLTKLTNSFFSPRLIASQRMTVKMIFSVIDYHTAVKHV